ncbi:MAG: DUF4925 domain-containing protein [Tannerellaceae bacterium]|nr:DUF4925 domain-containing protein [Tannerellaceae bacterium]
MKKMRVCYFIVFACFSLLFIACNSDDENFNGLIPSESNKVYTNKLASMNQSNQLALTYNGTNLAGKDVYFEILSHEKANLSLRHIIPGESECILENISLTALQENGYSFSGQSTSSGGTGFSYQGTIRTNKLTPALTDVTLPANLLSAANTWYNRKSSLVWEINSNAANMLLWGMATGIVGNLLDNLLLSVLNNVTFHTDGNITAAYAPLPEEAEISDMLMGSVNYNDRNPADWQTSPGYMAMYYMNGQKLYVVPQVEMLMNTLLGTGSKADVTEILNMIIDLLGTVIQWTNQGIEFTVEETTGNSVTLVLDKAQVEPIFSLLPYVIDFIPLDALPGGMGALEDMLGELLNIAATNTTAFEYRLTLSTQK